MKNIDGIRYHVQSDTALYYCDNVNGLHSTLVQTKEQVDKYFKELNTPSRLHISCSYGNLEHIDIKIEDDTITNITGEAMNKLQQVIYIAEDSDYHELNDRICYHQSAYNNLNSNLLLKNIEFKNIKFFYT